MHTPVLLSEAIDSLQVRRGGLYIDATVGEAGHFEKILEKGGRVLGIDWDEEQVRKAALRFKRRDSELVVGNFAEIERIATEHGFFPVNGILFDLGLSYSQLARSGKGFSYKNEIEPLDMRLSLRNRTTAADLINNLSENELYEILAKNAEEINSRAIAGAIVRSHRLKKAKTVGDLREVIDSVIGRKDEKVYARVFQALRMEVNNELENLRRGLRGGVNLLDKDGRIAVITFHSVEDRIVKKFITDNKLKQIEKFKKRNAVGFERSATLRIFTKN